MRAMRQVEEARWAEVPDPALEFTGRKLGDEWLKPGLTVEHRALVEQALDSRFSEATRKAYFTVIYAFSLDPYGTSRFKDPNSENGSESPTSSSVNQQSSDSTMDLPAPADREGPSKTRKSLSSLASPRPNPDATHFTAYGTRAA